MIFSIIISISFIYLSLFHLNRISQISIPKVSLSVLPQLSSSLKHSHTTVDLAVERQQRLRLVFHVGFLLALVLILVWDGFSVGLNWFWVGFFDGFGLFLSWVSWWVWLDFELGFLIACVDFGLIFHGFWVNFVVDYQLFK